MQFVRISHVSGHLAAYLVAVTLEQLALPDAGGLAFFWPAAGVAALWMLSSTTARGLVRDGALIVAVTTLVDVVLGVDLAAALLFGLANLTVGLVVRLTSSTLEDLPFSGRLPRRLSRTSDLGEIGIACFAAGLVSAAPGLGAVYAETGSLSWDLDAAWVVRTACSTFVVVGAVLGLLTAVLRAHAKRGWGATMTPRPRRHWAVELVLVSTATLAASGIVFGSREALPIAFVMIVASTWMGARFSPAAGGIYVVALTTLAALCTQQGRGPFGTIDDLVTRSVIVQVYALVTAVIVLMLSLGASERAALLARAVASESRATERAALLDAMTTVMLDGVVVLDSDGRVLQSNPAAESMAGLGGEEPAFGTPEQHGFVRADGSVPDPDELPPARALRGEFVEPADLLRINPATGQQTILSVSAMPLQHTDPSAPRVAVLVMRDVTKVRASRRQVENFAGVVAHDLKSPLTGVLSWAEMLEEQIAESAAAGDATLTSSVRHIRSSADRMSNLISDLLAYTHAQNAELAMEPVDLDEMVDQIARDLSETHHAEIPVLEHGHLGRVHADGTLVRQLLTNVIGNAVKYVAPGVVPHVVIGSAPIDDMLEIWVSDNGLGIPDQDLGRVFDSFFRATSTKDYPGTGLGLAICAHTVERHGGRISARKGFDGQGTSMIFTLPLETGPVTEPDPEPLLEPLGTIS